MLIELKFIGLTPILNFSFIGELSINAREMRFYSPEINFSGESDELISVFNSNDYVDFIINTDHLSIKGKNVQRVFINIGRNEDEIEVLIFFNLADLREPTAKMAIDYLKSWTPEFQRKYDFEYFICQIDNASEDEYYFDSIGLGKLYHGI